MRVKDVKIPKNLSVDELIRFVNTASKFESDITIKGPNFQIDGKSIIGVMTVISAGSEVTIITKGDDEEEALKAVSGLLV